MYPKKTESLRGGASQKSARGRGGLQAPQKDPEPGFRDQNLVFFVQTIWTFSITVKLDFKELLNKEQIDFKELFTDYQLFYTINLLLNKELLLI